MRRLGAESGIKSDKQMDLIDQNGRNYIKFIVLITILSYYYMVDVNGKR